MVQSLSVKLCMDSIFSHMLKSWCLFFFALPPLDVIAVLCSHAYPGAYKPLVSSFAV